MDDNVLLYATAGVAFVKSEFTAYNDLDDAPEVGSVDLNSTSYVIGAGGEGFVMDNVTVRAEALYFGSMEEHTFREDQLTSDMDAGDYGQIDGMYVFRVGVAYHF